MPKNISLEDTALQEALSPIVNRLIDKNYETSQDKIATQMAPLIGSAIREQIKSHKDDVVDALYPVLGNMISRYVTKTLEDMLNSINIQIQNGLSLKSLKRKLKAKLKGISESELLLNENATANIRALLLIHKETGIVLAHSENPNKPISEPEMLASMMSAIRSFINEWVEQNSTNQELGEIEYGGNKIIIEASGYSYLAVIVEGSAYKATYDKIRETLENIVLNHGDNIRNFNGDLDSFANMEIYHEISILLNNDAKEEEEKKKKIHSLLFLIPFFLLLWGSYSYYINYTNTELEQQIQNKLHTTSQLTSFNINATLKDGVVILTGSIPFKYYKELAQKLVQKIKGVNDIKNELIIVNSLQDPMQISSNIAYFLRGFNTQKGVNLTYSYDYKLLTIKGSLWNVALQNRLKQELQKIPNIKEIHYELSILPPQLDMTIYFKKKQTFLSSKAQQKLIQAIDTLNILDSTYLVTLTAYSDQIGTKAKNLLLSQQRVSTIESFLKNQGKIKNNFLITITNEIPSGVDVIHEANKARCVVISYTERKK